MKPNSNELAALQRLWKIANGHSGQCRIVARFLLGLYNGTRFPFDLTDFRSLDNAIFLDCQKVMVMDSRPWKEVHVLLKEDGATDVDFERLASDWRIPNAKWED